jgi:uncharacterized metal-binding protein
VTSTYATTWEYSKSYCGNYDNNDDSLVLLNGLYSFYTSPFMNFKYLGQNGRPNWNNFLLCPFKIFIHNSSNEQAILKYAYTIIYILLVLIIDKIVISGALIIFKNLCMSTETLLQPLHALFKKSTQSNYKKN